MYRVLAGAIFGYAGLCSALWCLLIWAPAAGFRCGNVVTDPFGLMVNVGAPLSLYCSVILALFCLRDRRWPKFAMVAWLVFLFASVGLFYETTRLAEYGLEVGSVWWLPWR